MPASLTSIELRGVRSYSPLESKTQTIEFMPLTLIVGSNGSGKTTLIEALKFIISGEEPPLSDCRRNFLHTNHGKTGKQMAQIELKFQSANDGECIARRQIFLTSSAKNPTPSITSSYKLSKNPWVNVNKQDDWSRFVPKLFNLPNKAIVDNVILCHQEENLWSMADSSTVKQIFDKIFGCEQYKKEIKHIETEMKACKSDLALNERDVLHNKDKVERMRVMRQQIDDLKNEVKAMQHDIKELSVKIDVRVEEKQSLNVEMGKLENKVKEIESLERTAHDSKGKKSKLIEQLGASLIDLETSKQVLLQKLDDHKKLIDQNKRSQRDIRGRETSLRSEIEALEQKKDLIHEEINRLKVFQLKSRETMDNLIESLQNIKIEHSLDAINPSDFRTSLRCLDEKEQSLLQRKSCQAELEDNLSSQQQKLNSTLTVLEGTHRGLLEKVKTTEGFVKNLREQLSRNDPITKDLVIVSSNIGRMAIIASQIPKSDLVSSLECLIDDTTKIMDKLIIGQREEGTDKIKKDIAKESQVIERSKIQLRATEDERVELSSKKALLEKEYANVKMAAKEAHNRVMMFRNIRQNVLATYQRYLKEKQIADSHDIQSKMGDLADTTRMIKLKQEELKSLSLEISRLSEWLGRSFELSETYEKNIQVRDLIEQLNALEDKISSLKSSFDIDQLAQLKSQLKVAEREELEFHSDRSRLEGSKTQIDREIIRLEPELKTFSNTSLKYSGSLGHVVCNKIVLKDLEKLKECFQHSITSFHNQMIVKINEVLKVRWRQIYQGSDIDHIELVDEEISRGKDKKSFNYHIAMQKGNIKMRMREKSSAGQRALASIILRMTLAELFVKDFAFIALDEPTANLDLANVRSLARAIGSYVKRRTQKGVNIQWIIITHDEEFLKALDEEHSPYYYKVSLDHEKCSMISKISFQDVESLTSSVPSSSSGSTQ